MKYAFSHAVQDNGKGLFSFLVTSTVPVFRDGFEVDSWSWLVKGKGVERCLKFSLLKWPSCSHLIPSWWMGICHCDWAAKDQRQVLGSFLSAEHLTFSLRRAWLMLPCVLCMLPAICVSALFQRKIVMWGHCQPKTLYFTEKVKTYRFLFKCIWKFSANRKKAKGLPPLVYLLTHYAGGQRRLLPQGILAVTLQRLVHFPLEQWVKWIVSPFGGLYTTQSVLCHCRGGEQALLEQRPCHPSLCLRCMWEKNRVFFWLQAGFN